MNGGRFRVLKMGVSEVFRAVSSREAIHSRKQDPHADARADSQRLK
jgi:hypothetical protein